jgi:hypothetical protein
VLATGGITRRHVLSEGWQVLANLMQVGLETEWTRPVYDKDDKLYGWEARVICRAKDGQVIGSAESMCCRDERRWENANEHALRSMAQTRAVSRALRQCIGFIVKLSGFEATPAEELDAGGAVSSPTPGPRPAPPAPSRAEGQKKLSMTERGELASLAHATEQKTGVGARDIMNAVCTVLAIRPLDGGGWDIRKKDYDKVSAAVMTWEPPETQDDQADSDFGAAT